MFLELFQSNFILLKYIPWHYHHHTAYKIQYKSFTSAFKVLQNRILTPSQFYFLYLNKLDCILVLQTCINHTHLFPSSLLFPRLTYRPRMSIILFLLKFIYFFYLLRPISNAVNTFSIKSFLITKTSRLFLL